jgi:Putative phage serine protease XkdF
MGLVMRKVKVKKTVEEKQLVFAEVYAPGSLDTDIEFMSEEEIEKAAHSFMKRMMLGNIDVMHDNISDGSYVVESFIAMEGQNLFIPGSWVVGVKVSDESWEKVKKGELNGFSLEALTFITQKEVTIDIPNPLKGTTSKEVSLSESVPEHEHSFTVSYDPESFIFLGGKTDVVEGHFHTIIKSTNTEYQDGHRHRFCMVEDIKILEVEDEN